MNKKSPYKSKHGIERIALVLQGGGALGAYQVGVFEALDAGGFCPQWFAGTSIGAINAAIIAGNRPEQRLEKLSDFWKGISRPDGWQLSMLDEQSRKRTNQWHSFEAMVFGQPGFFYPRPISPWFSPAGSPEALSFFDTEPLRKSLAESIDFELINSGAVRLSLGAVNVRSGRQVYFDSKRCRIGHEQVMASAALPPSFAPVDVDGELYWDGGILSNTPLDTVLDDEPRVSTLCFVVDLWDPMGPVPRSMDDVLEREKDIRYASRTERHIANYRRTHDLRRAVTALWEALPAGQRADSAIEQLAWLGCSTTMQIVHLIYQNAKYETACKDYEFSRASIEQHRAAGLRDARRALDERLWEQPVPANQGVVVHQYPRRDL